MAEAEDVITDAARHATVFARALWRRHHPPAEAPATVRLGDLSQRLDLLVTAVFGGGLPLRVAQPPPHPTLLQRCFGRVQAPLRRLAVPATDGTSLWLPADSGCTDSAAGAGRYRLAVLRQAARALRGSAQALPAAPLPAAIYLLLEAQAADTELAALLPGMAPELAALRHATLRQRPPLSIFSPARRPLEQLLRGLLAGESVLPATATPRHSAEFAAELAQNFAGTKLPLEPLLLDWWSGELRRPAASETGAILGGELPAADDPPRSARLARRPRQRAARPGEDEKRDEAPWMVQPEGSHPHAEDPMGLQRPVDRDEQSAAEEYADLVSELAEARLVATPGSPREVLLSDDAPQGRTQHPGQSRAGGEAWLHYPEWDYRSQSYRSPGARVLLVPAATGSPEWVTRTLETHRTLLDAVRRRFDMLRGERQLLRRQLDGDELDVEACIESHADFHAGRSSSQALYQVRRPARRSVAISLLIDISGSTDSWVSSHRRVIDVEREALLLVCTALERLGQPFAVQAFSGRAMDGVTVSLLKDFAEPYGDAVALRIAALEPEHYTRAGAAIRHASAQLAQQPAMHRLLLLLSDGKPNDTDHYQGRYGIEDTRQAVIEARLQHIHPFCLTIDRQASDYLPHVFGAGQYALLPQPERLPRVLLDWMKRLLAD
jgi:nitric oxide reductase NorD protein